ncbi:hypothetical protein N5D28_20600 [Stutzerimonas stutzeri]|uniref:hypothetical protein n=1 Tax=Stutzerimonas stutzeri TaxID=316 RepID=UPI002448E6C8|nr:hypothetical protein [Stutzerimonas stutzeri]MDH0611283.1 hypothetical protein [Stutzerimonas stutzeri]
MNIDDNEPLPTPEIIDNEVRITSLPEAWQKRFWDETGAITMRRAGWVPLDNWMAFAERHQSLETSNSYPAMDS